jgi:hypothetical protein
MNLITDDIHTGNSTLNDVIDTLEYLDDLEIRNCDRHLVRRLSMVCKILAAKCDYLVTIE